ncbi:ubiquitin carboxyl-terminal hydrolase 22 [Agrilus planipennis]|uniref:Ubiquitin carboxyl-terminal hydrolase n=1 Tax=Agrilus planipennis TaxID=224129 RepID=A0A1W4X9M9_AGRPL|nr:ubiquitin carboxyl-terminal hydrolase 22 [Agrilus planipennis]
MANGCAHLDYYKSTTGVKAYRILHAIFVMTSSNHARKAKLKNSFCHVCKKMGPFLHSCLHCVFLGCHKHIREHTENKLRHCLSMDLCYGQVHCSQCKDYVYDKDIDNIGLENKISAGKFHIRMFNWATRNVPESDREIVNKHGTKIDTISLDSTVGLRGLLNLGATCFMNCIIQALTHTPLLRDYFFTDIHQCKDLSSCLISRLFYEFYNGEKSPLSLHEFLYHIWTRAEHLAGYVQQDAQEFLIATLGVLHQHFEESMPPSINKDKNKLRCTCIVDQIFTGTLQSDVMCQECNGISRTYDPISDFSLDLGSMEEQPPTSLIECLERYTRAEHLGSSKIECSNCRSPQVSTKQLSVKTLPVVVTFQFKRFLHIREKEKKIKISSFISFPETLDMTPFTSQARSQTPSIVPPDNRYSLFAVINHEGNSVNTGHYICFVRQQRNYWFKCDDQNISRASLADVLNSEAYLLFYHKHILAYD